MSPEKFADTPCRMCGSSHVIVTGAWCQAQRKAAKLSLRALANRFGLAPETLWDVEHGRLRCTPRIRKAYESLEQKETAA